MEKQEERKWHLVRNNNGEWISSDNVVYLDGLSATIYKSRAGKYGLPLSPQKDCDGELWCYRHELEAVIAAIDAHRQEVKPLKLKIDPAKQKHTEKEINDMVMDIVKTKNNNEFAALNKDNKLWDVLDREKNPPQWWKNILEDKDLYVEIRKDNYLNIYYYGGNVALIKWKNGEVVAETHQKYLGDFTPIRTRIKTTEKENGEIVQKKVNVFESRNCMDKLQTKEGLEEIKRHIDETYLDIHGRNKHGITKEKRDDNNNIHTSSEKKVQGKLKLHSPNLYLDSEFAYRISKDKLIRFDLIELKDGILTFIELKLITDSRMKVRNGKPEIIEQMERYCNFIHKHKDELKNYYTDVLEIKKNLGLWNGDAEIKGLSLRPRLWVINTYKGTVSEDREKRKEYIDNLDKTNFDIIIEEYDDLWK